MPWREVSRVSQRTEFIAAAGVEGANVRALCREYGISAKTGYKWIARYSVDGPDGLVDSSRRPHNSPSRSSPEIEQLVVGLRKARGWGSRKIRARLLTLGHPNIPSVSTITTILHRYGLIDPAESAKHKPFIRFERATPNELWQMDFKGHFALEQGRCHPLTVLDDHSRFCVGLRACSNEQGTTVQLCLEILFRHYGLPAWMLMDNGSPWGVSDGDRPSFTPLTVWLLRLGIGVSHGRPYHPQTQGKDERFHRTLSDELLHRGVFADLESCQNAFDAWREVYNAERPHEAIGLVAPSTKYQPSPRLYPEKLPPLEYPPGMIVRTVQDKGRILFLGRHYHLSKAFHGYRVGLKESEEDGVYAVLFGSIPVGSIDCRCAAE